MASPGTSATVKLHEPVTPVRLADAALSSGYLEQMLPIRRVSHLSRSTLRQCFSGWKPTQHRSGTAQALPYIICSLEVNCSPSAVALKLHRREASTKHSA